jgi:hypothetical protein
MSKHRAERFEKLAVSPERSACKVGTEKIIDADEIRAIEKKPNTLL